MLDCVANLLLLEEKFSSNLKHKNKIEFLINKQNTVNGNTNDAAKGQANRISSHRKLLSGVTNIKGKITFLPYRAREKTQIGKEPR